MEFLESIDSILDISVTVLSVIAALYALYVAILMKGGAFATAWKWMAAGLVFLGLSALIHSLHEILELIMLLSFLVGVYFVHKTIK